uniref:FERM domain-containing protein n=1 Tax=Oncorhynchus mykiss TaxID=8022 RepID=A0A8K9WLC4_ONCMY
SQYTPIRQSRPQFSSKPMVRVITVKRARGQLLFAKVCDHLNLLETDYFGMTYRDVENQKNWLDPNKELKKQIRSGPWNFGFNVKFYPPDPAQLSEDITRYYLCLQLRDDMVSGRLPCSFTTHTILGSYTVQSELGDYDPEETEYNSELRFAPNHTKELEDKVMDLHKNYKGMTPAEAELHFLENAKKLSMYGVDLHHAKDSEGVEIMLGVCSSGLLIYRDRLRINRFAWPKVLKISYKRNNFYIKIRPGEFEQFESTIGFKLPNHRAAKRLWKTCVEHHTFFRLVSPEAPPKKFLGLGSKFRYSGRTQAQTRRVSSQIIRAAPIFERSSSKRYTMSRSLDGAPVTENHDTLMREATPAKAVAAGDLITTVTPEKKAEEEKAEEEEGQTDATETSDPNYSFIRRIKGENVFIKHSNLMLEVSEKTKKHDLVKRQRDVSELKRSFLETSGGAESLGLTEWEKRLSSSPPARSHSEGVEEAPMIEPLNTPQDSVRTRNLRSTRIHANVTSDWTDRETDGEEEKFLVSPELKISPGTVRQEVSTAILDKRGTLIILREMESEDKMDTGRDVTKTNQEKGGGTSASVKEGEDDELDGDPLTRSKEKYAIIDTNEDDGEVDAEAMSKETILILLLMLRVLPSCVPLSSLLMSSPSVPVISQKPEAVPAVESTTKEVPVVHTETKTITYESSEGDYNGDVEPGVLMSAQTVTSETTSTTTTTHITKTVKGGISETRIEKRIVITGEAGDIDHDQALAQAIKEAKEQHPDMSVTKVVVHKETEITPEGED